MRVRRRAGRGTSPTLSALRAYREHRAAGRRGLPPDVSLDFAPPALQPLIRRNGVTDRRRWESALFLQVRDELQTVQLRHRGREELRPLRDLLPAHPLSGSGSAKRSGRGPDSPSTPTWRSRPTVVSVDAGFVASTVAPR